jgi:hypothetical protein
MVNQQAIMIQCLKQILRQQKEEVCLKEININDFGARVDFKTVRGANKRMLLLDGVVQVLLSISLQMEYWCQNNFRFRSFVFGLLVL